MCNYHAAAAAAYFLSSQLGKLGASPSVISELAQKTSRSGTVLPALSNRDLLDQESNLLAMFLHNTNK